MKRDFRETVSGMILDFAQAIAVMGLLYILLQEALNHNWAYSSLVWDF
ncbi:hypothetical protein WKW50_25705 [Ochrobactrum sp. GPK 3]